jgi:adenosylmethionine-8-amino-7-oxononanoate aminotransferase
MTAVELDADLLAEDPAAPVKAYKAVREQGVILRALGRALAVSPPLVIEPDEIAQIADGLRAGLDAMLEARQPAGATAA